MCIARIWHKIAPCGRPGSTHASDRDATGTRNRLAYNGFGRYSGSRLGGVEAMAERSGGHDSSNGGEVNQQAPDRGRRGVVANPVRTSGMRLREYRPSVRCTYDSPEFTTGVVASRDSSGATVSPRWRTTQPCRHRAGSLGKQCRWVAAGRSDARPVLYSTGLWPRVAGYQNGSRRTLIDGFVRKSQQYFAPGVAVWFYGRAGRGRKGT
jgi:hypothetical protein